MGDSEMGTEIIHRVQRPLHCMYIDKAFVFALHIGLMHRLKGRGSSPPWDGGLFLLGEDEPRMFSWNLL